MARARYAASSRYQLDEGGITASRLEQESVVYTLHVVKSLDTLENIAHRLLGDHLRWWEIADLNPQILDSFMSLTPGTTIRIPS